MGIIRDLILVNVPIRTAVLCTLVILTFATTTTLTDKGGVKG